LVRLSGIRVVLFDIYGTMIISGCGDVGTVASDGRGEAVAGAFAAVGLTAKQRPSRIVEVLEAVIRSHQEAARAEGIDYPEVDIVAVWADVVASLSKGGTDREDADHVDCRRLAIEYEVRANPVWPMPHLAECLDRLCRSERLLGVISNAQFFTPVLFPALLGRSLTELGFDGKLQFFSYEHRHGKPSDELFRLAGRELASRSVSPDEVLYVGNDMLNDVTPAAAFGMRTALFAGDARSLRLRTDDARTTGVAPDIVLTDLLQLIECLLPLAD
jgi:putative hydrolase of the HAD superfamily